MARDIESSSPDAPIPLAELLLVLNRQAPGRMGLRARQSSIKLALLAGLSPTGGATNRHGVLLRFHDYIVQYRQLTKLVNCDQS
jgi:hypothetical protein